MSVLKIVSRYAKSLFDLAKADGKLDKVHQDIMYTWEVTKLEDFDRFLKSPIISTERKKGVMKAIFADKANVEPVVVKTFNALLEHKREIYLSDFCRTFHLEYNKEQKISAARLISAVELSEETVTELLDVFKAKGFIEEKVELIKEVDPAIIGGFILEFNDQVYNSSLAYKLENLRKNFSENLYTKNI